MNFFFRFIRGYYFVTFYSSGAERILNFILENNIPVWNIVSGEKSASFCISSFHIGFLEPFKQSITKEERLEEKKRGTLRILELFGARWGFFLGFLFFCASLLLSTLFVWGVEVVGNDKISALEIKKDLVEYGVKPGALISSFDPKEAGMRYQIAGDRFVYVNVNIIGTKALVEVRERAALDKTKKEENPSNLVAEIYGTIERFEVLSGQVQIKRGDRVTAGQLLISGVKENNTGTVSLVPAKGRVFAKTARFFQTTVLSEEKKRVFTGVEKEKITLEILGISLPFPFFSNCENERFEKLEITEDLTLFGRVLPVRIRRVFFLETEEKKESIILDRQRDLAYDKYVEFKRETFASDDEILEENLSLEEGPEGLIFTAEIVAIEDICKEIPFRVF